jgi:hypothetical protein
MNTGTTILMPSVRRCEKSSLFNNFEEINIEFILK